MPLIVSQAVGFFVQFFPCTVLALFAFDSTVFRIKKPYLLTGFMIYTAAVSVLFSFLHSAAREDPDIIWHYYANSIFYLAAIVVFAVYMLVVRKSAMEKIMAFCPVIYYAFTVYFTSNVIDFAFSITGPDSGETYPLPFMIIMTAVSAVVFPIFCFLMNSTVRKFFRIMEPKNIKVQFALCIFLTVCELVPMMDYSDSVSENTVDEQGMVLPGLVHLVFISAMLVYYWVILELSAKTEKENQLNKQLEIQRLQYDHITEQLEDAKRMRHDIRHFANVLGAMLGNGRLDEAQKMLESFTGKAEAAVSENFCTNAAVNGILQYYIDKARRNGIYCEVTAQCGELDIDTLSMTVILGNVLENAIRSCEKAENVQSFISVKIGTVGTFLAIQIDNSCSAVKLSREYMGQSGYLPAQAYESLHGGKGYGLVNAEYAAVRHGGSASFSYIEESHTFSSRIRLNITR